MKYDRFINIQTFVVMLFLASCLIACEENFEASPINEDNYIISDELLGYLTGQEGKRTVSSVEFRDAGSTLFYLNTSKKVSQDCSVTLVYDEAALDAYNIKNQTDYKAFPERCVTIDNGGKLTISAGYGKSEALKISYRSDNSLNAEDTYVIPLVIDSKSTEITIPLSEQSHLIFVKDLTSIPDCHKSTGAQIISCMEVNDTNPLNNLCFTLKNSNKPLIDMVILFAANINYDTEKQKVYIYNNPNVQHLLSNRKKYLKPLQDRGMKVLLGIVGNHDRAAVGNLADPTAKAFAQEVKAMCEAYQLDGVFMDDEHSSEMHPAPLGFVDSSSKAAARLCYEIKQAMPERIIAVYVYKTTYSLPSVDGHLAGEYVDYGIHDYGRSSDLSGNYPGMPKAHMALWSQEFHNQIGTEVTEEQLRNARNNGYLSHMIFAMDPLRQGFEVSELLEMQKIAKAYFDDELVYDGKPYKKDW